ncbi:MAG TPA: DUF883 family protein [Verrucomicrobiae bacterium]|nr:DUF883 family protein [Verrucomicrobiae bacterium]
MSPKASLEAAASNGNGNGKADGAHPRPLGAVIADTPVMRELQSFVADIEDLVTATTSMSAEDLARAKAKLASRMASAQQSAKDAGTAVDQYTHTNPWKAVGMGAAAGTLIGLVFGALLARRA